MDAFDHAVDKACKAQLEALRGRLLHAIVVIEEDHAAAEDISVSTVRTRLHGKSQGVRLALSYVDEALREGRWRPGPGW